MRRRARFLAAGVLLALAALLVLAVQPRVPTGAALDPLWRATEILDRSYAAEVSADDLIDGAAAALAEAVGRDADELAAVPADGPAPDKVPAGYEPLWHSWHAAATGLPIRDAPDLVAVAIRGMVAATGDPHALVVTGDHSDEDEYFDDEQTGIGAIIQQRDGQIVIDQPFPGGPAARAGARPGDVVLTIDGQRVTATDVGGVAELLRGEAGTAVVLLLDRELVGEVEITITRDTLPLTSAGAQNLAGGIGHLHITRFAADTPALVAERLDDLVLRGARGVVLDLRGNPGGRPSAATQVVDQFLDGGVAYVAENLDGVFTQVRVRSGGPAAQLPIALVVDERTAGAAELYAVAIRDHGRAPVFGMRTAGDTALHRPHQVADDLAIVVRDGRWHAPSGRPIAADGLMPDFEVPLLEDDIGGGYDRQLAAAYSYLWLALGGAVEPG
jgi:carboxyl-terminal processing protease